MEQIKLGFGSVGLSKLDNEFAAIPLLNQAYKEAITHFDTTPLYGMGKIEAIVEKFLTGNRDKIRTKTKFGLNPPSLAQKQNGFLNLEKTIIKKLLVLGDMARKRVMSSVTNSYTPEMARKSLVKSLKELKTDYVDYYLLHEAGFEEAAADELRETL